MALRGSTGAHSGATCAPSNQKAVRHLVLLRPKPDTSKTAVEEFLAAAAQLPRKIPGMLSYEVGRDLGLPAPGLNAEIAITGNFE